MAEECTDHQGSVAITSSSTPLMIMNWWDHLPPPGSWSNISNPSSNWHQLHPIMNPNCHDDDQDDHLSISTSFNSHTPNSNHSGLAVESAPRRGILLNHVEPAVSSNQNLIESSEHASDHHSQIWSHVLSSIENNSSDQMHNDEDVAGENFLDALSSKSNNMIMSRGSHLFDQVQPACDYLKKLDMNMTSTYNDDWDHDHHYPIIQSQLVDNRPGFNFNPDQLACNPNTNNNISTINSISSSSIDNESYSRTNDDHDYYGALNMNRDRHETTSDSYTSTGPRNFAHHDFISFNALLSKPLIDTTISHAAKPASFLKSLNLSDHHGKKQHRGANSSPTRASTGRGNASNHGKKKRYEDMTASETVLIKKTKQETSTAAAASANKTLQQPKVKLGDRITKLQQIVSPFGKTDTASVLLEAIGYIKFLQEQVELLSNPYMMKTNSLKDTWGCSEKKERGGGHHSTTLDLKSRGLCLVPVSCTPQVYRDNNGSDYLSPTYRGCFYRS